jgi:hypothetical protein
MCQPPSACHHHDDDDDSRIEWSPTEISRRRGEGIMSDLM